MKKKKPNKPQTDEVLNDIKFEDPAEAAAKAAAEAAEGSEGVNTGDDTDGEAEQDAEISAEAQEPEAGQDNEKQDNEKQNNEKQNNEKQNNEWKEKYTRQLAEFDNFRKRTEKEKAQMYDYGAKAIAEKILPTIDNFERGLKGAPEGAFTEGMEMVYKQLLKNLEDAGVKAIDCVGKEFDPNIHNAVMHEEDDSGEENIVTEEFQKGYMYKETLLRPSMVKVKN